jgi:hypothetical protein
MNDSHNLKHVLANIRQGSSAARQSEFNDNAFSKKQAINQLNEDGHRAGNFFENHFTPKSAAIQQTLQKPWDVTHQREKLKHISIYRAAIQSENILHKPYSDIDPTLKRLINISFNRLDTSKAFIIWTNHLKNIKNVVKRSEQKKFLKIIRKIQKKKMAKKFVFWKYMLGVKEDQYSF